jgi:uncharacterized protein HemX
MVLVIVLASSEVGAVPWLVPDRATDDETAEQAGAELREGLDQVIEELAASNNRLGRLESDQAELSGRVDAQGESIAENRERSAEALRGVERTDQDLNAEIDELRAQMQQIWQRQGEQREIDRDIQRRLLLMEAASLLAFGKARAELSDDIDAAREAYRQADALVRRADDPDLGQVRRMLAQELDALENLKVPDWLGLQGAISRQARSVSEWPIAQTSQSDAATGDERNAEPDGWIDATRDALGGLVKVSPRASSTLSDPQIATLREMARLRWLAAELAIARRDTAELDHHLRSLDRFIDQRFDSDSDAVQSARRLIDEVEAMEVSPMPDILGQALTALRQYLDSA